MPIDHSQSDDYVTLKENEQYLFDFLSKLHAELLPNWESFKALVKPETADELASAVAVGSDPRIPYACDKNGEPIQKGDSVEVPDPDESDSYNHSFMGLVVSFDNGLVTVVDGDNCAFSIEPERLVIINELNVPGTNAG